ncbi:MAG TPA: BlaI/MecI/CopY family transcriptional regulator [Candidatus Merdivicinus intestinavium]|nr:BlaI/MecI/CopY family transcriptional regulator [Candidatus Merdivicinus intestinavium]
MERIKLFDAEYRLMDIIWDREPVNSTELSRVCQEKLGWKKPTTYNMLRKLGERGILQNENATVTALVKREQILRCEGEELVEKAGSLPAFLAAFLKGRKITAEEAAQLRRMIEEAEDHDGNLH